MTRKSKRELERAAADLDAPPVEPPDYNRIRADARERWESDEYDTLISKLWDAYTLAFEEREALINAIKATWEYFDRIDLGVKAYHAEEFDHAELPALPPVPTEAVAEVIIEYGERYGIDGHALQDRHGEDWLIRFVENLAYERARRDAADSPIVWKPAEVEDDIRRWRSLYEEEHRL